MIRQMLSVNNNPSLTIFTNWEVFFRTIQFQIFIKHN